MYNVFNPAVIQRNRVFNTAYRGSVENIFRASRQEKKNAFRSTRHDDTP